METTETEMDPSMMADLTIYNLPPMPPVWDEVGIFYVTFCATWTTLVLAGMAFCWFNRRLPILKIRGLALSFSAIIFLHAYWILAQITYPIGPTMPVVLAYEVQYFFMSIWFPLGIALFQASNLRFLHVAKLQKQFVGTDLRSKDGCNGAHSSWLCRLRNMNYTKRIMMFISVGIVAQVCSSLCPFARPFAAQSRDKTPRHRDLQKLTRIRVDSPYLWYVGGLQEVPSVLWHTGNRDPWRQPRRAAHRPWSRLGVVALGPLASDLDLDCTCPLVNFPYF